MYYRSFYIIILYHVLDFTSFDKFLIINKIDKTKLIFKVTHSEANILAYINVTAAVIYHNCLKHASGINTLNNI